MTSSCRWSSLFLELIRRTACDLPSDVERALKRLRRREPAESHSRWVLDTLLANVRLAREGQRPLCQDTGAPHFYLTLPPGLDERPLVEAAQRAVAAATRAGFLRRNTISTLTGREVADNRGEGLPDFHIERHSTSTIEIWLLLKGGGSENVSRQYALPEPSLGAQRDWGGVRACVLDALVRAQGMGCPPAILGVCVGGDRASGYLQARRQLLRPLDEPSPVPLLARFEREWLRDAERLGIGPMGFGGRGAVMGLKIGWLDRLPASFFVSIAYMCWACRRRGFQARRDGSGVRWQ